MPGARPASSKLAIVSRTPVAVPGRLSFSTRMRGLMKRLYGSAIAFPASVVLLLAAGCDHDRNGADASLDSSGEERTGDGDQASSVSSPWGFTEVTEQAGINFTHGYTDNPASKGGHEVMLGGVAAGDYDGDGFVDLYVLRGNIGGNLLLRNQGDGTFSDEAARAGVVLANTYSSGPVFAHVDQDRQLDLLVNGFNYTTPRLFKGRHDGTFVEATTQSGLSITKRVTVGATFSDYDRDGDLDVFLSHWGSVVDDQESTEHLWQNDGNGYFTDVSLSSGISWSYPIPSNVAGDQNEYH